MSALAIHKNEFVSPRTLPISALTARIIASVPVAMASSAAINPRLRHPRSSTGSDAKTKKIAGNIKGMDRCLVIFFKCSA
jgi:hypothetical protein